MRKAKKPAGCRKSFRMRKRYIKILVTLGIIWLAILFSPIYLHQKIQKVDEVFSQSFIESRELTLVDRYRYQKNGLVLEFAVDDEDGSLLKDLVNLNYKTEVKTANGDYQAIQQRFQKVSDSFFILTLKNMPDDYQLLKVTINGEQINRDVDTPVQKDMIFYLYQTSVKKSIKSLNEQKEKVHYEHRLLEKQVTKLHNQITKYEANIQLNKKLIKKVQSEMTYQTDDEKKDSQTAIDNYQMDNQTSESQIGEVKNQIKTINKKIALENEQATLR
ncbi:hypothetical protein [Enterococcus gilvus]|uniref:hypothetical protein n=1 Tax=Enterococcus gilvus TaxID=160453 RepID=UPI0028D45F2E|nr:hypothetical protein [Enterococcus gilvus]